MVRRRRRVVTEQSSQSSQAVMSTDQDDEDHEEHFEAKPEIQYDSSLFC